MRAASLTLDVEGQRALADTMVRTWAVGVVKAIPPEGVEALKWRPVTRLGCVVLPVRLLRRGSRKGESPQG